MKFRWDFEGEGVWNTSWSSEMELFHQFTQPGEYWVTMEAEDEGGERGITKTLVLVSTSTAQTGFIKDRRDGKYYGTVKIGDQWWMSDNLDYRTNPKMNIEMLQKCYGDPYGQCDLYGALYQGERAVGYTGSGKNICPDGWRLPSKQDWLKLGEQVPATGGRDAMLVGGSMGFNGRYTGYMTFQFIYDPYDPEKIVDTVYFSNGITEEVKFLSTTTRPYQFELQAQFYMGLQRKFDGVDLLWGDLNGYFYARCIKND
jgi:uncharacterized protein (TIGR02145 family)